MNLPLIDITINNTIHVFEENGRLLYKYLPFQNLKVKDISSGQIDLKELTLDSYTANIDINSPIALDAEVSYDQSVNLIVNDGNNPLKLVNSRFYLTDSTHYKIADRKGNLDTNIYTEDDFKVEAGLIKATRTIMGLDFLGISDGGNMPVGSYYFYFKLADSDGNETDFISESGKVVCHIGAVNQPSSIRGGLLDENSNKVIKFKLKNIDLAYDYINIYYTRSSGDDKQSIVKAYKIVDKYKIKGAETELFITGYEQHEEIAETEINVKYATFDSVQAIENCQNITFVGNISRNYEIFKTLEKYSLYVVPQLASADERETIGNLNAKYVDNYPTEGNEYYNAKNIYYKLGYWDEDIYRFGIVYILNDYTLSPEFNIRGIKELTEDSIFTDIKLQDPINYSDDYILENTSITNPENVKGIFKISDKSKVFNGQDTIKPIGIKFKFTRNVIDGDSLLGIQGLKELTKGFFIVRQKRIPTLLTQAVGIATSTNCYIPIIKANLSATINNNYIAESFLKDQEGKPLLGRDFFTISDDKAKNNALLCPEASLRPYIFNNFFNSSEFILKRAKYSTAGIFTNTNETDNVLFSLGGLYPNNNIGSDIVTNLTLVEPGIELLSNDNSLFSSRAGNVLEPWQHLDPVLGDINNVFTNSTTPEQWSNTVTKVRGEFNSFLGSSKDSIEFGQVYNIFQKGYNFSNNWKDYFRIRYNDASPFMAICDRTSWTDMDTNVTDVFYRGDCYIATYTHRMNWNFIDDEVPTNYRIVDPWTWYKNYRVVNTEIKLGGVNNDIVVDNTSGAFTTGQGVSLGSYKKVVPVFTWKQASDNETDITLAKMIMPDGKQFDVYSESNGVFGTDKINKGDVNSISIGHWVTFKICSNHNLEMRDIDFSRPEEEALLKNKRKFHPLETANIKIKLPESSILNSGLSETLSNRYYFEIPDVPFIKDSFTTRIYYSNVLQETSFKNGNRVFKAKNYQDYTLEHGKLVRLIDWFGRLVAVMEHGVLMIPVNERALVKNEMGEDVYINTDTVLPKNPKELSNNYGSLWYDSIVVSPRFIYGIDTVAKKIWRTNGESFEVISDLKIQSFLNNNIKLFSVDTDRTPGIHSIKSHFNAFKSDVIFVFKYDDYKFSLCWNELLNKWVTQYNWFPEFSENINNIFYTFANNVEHPTKGHILFKHGFAGNMEENGIIKPTMWYDAQKEFEFEFVVIGEQGVQKIFDNLKIISNLTSPSEFYYEIIGSSYDWDSYKDSIYGYTTPTQFTNYLNTNTNIKKIPYILTTPNFYNVTKPNLHQVTLVNNVKTNEKSIISYQKGYDISKHGRLKGNMEYVEDFWDIQIQPIKFKYAYLKNGVLNYSSNTEMNIRDKYIKIRIKYDGTKYSIINAIKTLFTISYA